MDQRETSSAGPRQWINTSYDSIFDMMCIPAQDISCHAPIERLGITHNFVHFLVLFFRGWCQ